MPFSDLFIHRFAHLFIQLHREEATERARAMVEQMRGKGDQEGADSWLQIIEAMGELGGVINLAPDVDAPPAARRLSYKPVNFPESLDREPYGAECEKV